MDRVHYESLVAQCDAVLGQFREYPSIMAVPWLHVLNDHPNTLHKYESFFRKGSAWRQKACVIKSLAYMGYKLFSSFIPPAGMSSGKSDIVFISHYIHVLDRDNIKEFYYGELPDYLSSRGVTQCIGFIDHTSGRKKVKNFPGKVLFSKTLSSGDEWEIIKQCLQSFRRINRAARRESDRERKSFLREAALQSLSRQTCATLRIYANIKQLLKLASPSVLVITWEGWSWERMAIKAARETGKNILCTGYQHAVLFPGSHALKRSLGYGYDPDVLLMIGETTKRIFESAGTFRDTFFVNYGSHRTGYSTGKRNKDTGIVCMVAPEGIESECVLLFDFAIRLAKEIPEMDFVFRTHPVLPFSIVREKYDRFASLPSNCHISGNDDISKDFAISRYILYRGTSTVIHAVRNGVRPIYYQLLDEPSIDPLCDLQGWKLSVTGIDDFKKEIQKATVLSDDREQGLFDEALSFCNDYMNSPDHEVFYRVYLDTKTAN